MPTDGADFGRTRPCYGKAFTMTRDAADDGDVAECVIRGVELDIKRDGGAPSFKDAVALIVTGSSSQMLLLGADGIRQKFVDSPLTRHLAEGAVKVGLGALKLGKRYSTEQAAQALIIQLGVSRCCDGMVGYITRHRTKNVAESQTLINSIKEKLPATHAAQSLASRMLNCSPKGLPRRPPKGPRLEHTAQGLDEEL